MHTNYTTKHKHLTIETRRNIERWKLEGKSNREIARLLGKAPQTINNEIKKGQVLQQVRKSKFEKVYKADYAQSIYEQNRKNSSRKSKQDKEVIIRIQHYLKQKYTPEMIVNSKNVPVSSSTIYYWIYNCMYNLSTEYILYKRKKKTIKKEASPNYTKYGKIIDERPEKINNREELGHYEIDTVLLTRASNQCLLTLTDRKSRHQIIRLIPNKTANAVNTALIEIQASYNINSLTADNGVEFARLASVFDYNNIYYAHPYCSYERGTNENHNRLIRRWLPKGTIKTTPKEVAFIENWINNYPKKMFDYDSPSIFY